MNFKNKKSLVAVLLLIIITAFVINITPTFGAGEDPVQFDAIVYAKHHGVSVDEAMRRFELQDITGVLDAELSDKEVNTFAGLWIEHAPEFRVVVQFTHDGEKTIKQYLPKNLVGITEIRTAKVSLVDLQSTQADVLSSVRSLGIPVDSEINVYENRVKVLVADRVQFENALRDRKLILPDNADVITVEALAKPAIDIYGGLTLSSGTSGFAVKTPSGTTGITAAGHASNSQWYNGIYLPLQQEKLERYYDIQWHTTPFLTDKNKIRWWSDGSTRDITATKSRNNQVIGGYVAKYGKITNYTAGYIDSKSVSLSYVPNSESTFIRVDDTAGYSPLVEVGDSGGPWFLTNTAYGTTCAKDALGRGYYMAINYVSGIGVSVMTSP